MKNKLVIVVFLFIQTLFSQSFHDTQGSLEVASGGQASFTVPVAMPPSISNVGPTINLTYSSGTAGGVMGQGWSISGISSIRRINARKDIDGFSDGVDFDDNDKLALDGQRLIVKTGTYWEDGSVYETEIHSNIKIQYFAGGTNSGGHFVVTQTDGSVTFYGETTNHKDNNAYYITRYEDVNKNRIYYYYTKLYNTLYLQSITFSENLASNTTPLNKIVFVYENALRQEKTFNKGIEMVNSRILKSVEVKTNDLLFKRYKVSHINDSKGYQRVSQVQEFNALDEPANPINFEYNLTSDSVTETTRNFSNEPFKFDQQPTATGDFDGDGKFDVIYDNKLYTKLFTQTTGGVVTTIPYVSPKSFAANTLRNNTLTQKQSIVIPFILEDQFKFNVHEFNGTTLALNYTKLIPATNLINCWDDCPTPNNGICYDIDVNGDWIQVPCPSINKCQGQKELNNKAEFVEGDFNGDGLTDVIILSKDVTKTYIPLPSPIAPQIPDNDSLRIPQPIELCTARYITSPNYSSAQFVDLNPNISTLPNSIGNSLIYNFAPMVDGDNKRFVADFNADGKTDIMVLRRDKSYSIITLKQSLVQPFYYFEELGKGFLPFNDQEFPILIADYNGDKITDVAYPICDGCSEWAIYYGNPKPSLNTNKEFFEPAVVKTIVEYRKAYQRRYGTLDEKYEAIQNFYYAIDFNKDGKSDIIRVYMRRYKPNWYAYRNLDTSWKMSAHLNNLGSVNQFIPYYYSPDHYSDNNAFPIPLALNSNILGSSSEFVVVRNHPSFPMDASYYDFKNDFTSDNRMFKVTQSNGLVVNEIEYNKDELIGTTTSQKYSVNNNVNYPFTEIERLEPFSVVTQLVNTSLGKTKKQDFAYNSYVINMSGIGPLGYTKTAKTAWYNVGQQSIVWNATISDPLMRGSVTKLFSKLGDLSFDFNDSNSFSKTVNTFSITPNTATGVYIPLLQKQEDTDFLKDIRKEKTYFYSTDGYYLPEKTTEKFYLGSVLNAESISNTTFGTNATGSGSNYYIGRPSETITTAKQLVNTLGGTSAKTASSKIFYNGANVSRTEKKANSSTETIIENFSYFANGLISSKTLSVTGATGSAAVAPRTTSYTYDPTNRFVKTTTDILGMVTTNNEYHPIYGTVLKQTNPYGQVTLSYSDNWGKNLKVTDFLGKSIYYTYSFANGIYTTLQTGDDGSASKTITNILGQNIKSGAKDINGNWSVVSTEYDDYGRKKRESQPYFESGSPTQWTNFAYDIYGRLTQTSAFNGLQVSNYYSGTTVTVTEPTITKIKTTNAVGQVTTAIDSPGGTINYFYDASSNLLESNYGGIITKMTYDNWGRKISLNDTSAGFYTYKYNALGETLEETTPKGFTNIEYDNFGRVTRKNVQGNTGAENTSIDSRYLYNDLFNRLTNVNVTNAFAEGGSTYTYTYDPVTNITNKTTEVTSHATFTEEVTFDNFGRISTQSTKAEAHGKTSTKILNNVYKNGYLWQVKDGATILKQINDVNGKGQLLTSTLGNGLTITNSYDNFGYHAKENASSNASTIYNFNYTFEPILGNLTARKNSLFDTDEKFEYDSNDRLKYWSEYVNKTIYNFNNNTTQGFNGFGEFSIPSVYTMPFITNNYRLTLDISHFNSGIEKDILYNQKTGDKLEISLFFKILKQDPNAMIASIVEYDPNDSSQFIEYNYPNLISGFNTFMHTIVRQGCTIKVRFKAVSHFFIDPESPLNPDDAISYSTYTFDDITIKEIKTYTQEYDNRGRITANETGKYAYNSAKQYQNNKISLTPLGDTQMQQQGVNDIIYTSFKAPVYIYGQSEKIDYTYNHNLQRSIMYYGSMDADKFNRPLRRYYSASGTIEVTFKPQTNEIEFLHYLDGNAYSADVVSKATYTNATPAGVQGTFYLHRDYQGSILAITNSVGGIVEKRIFDPWGKVLKVQDGAGNNLSKLTFFDRGYTGHEHLEKVGLIHMNGRLYDPVLHRFLMPDNFIQEPYNTQNYNRYGYVLNNPLKHIDINGEEIVFGTAVAIATAVGVFLYTSFCFLQGQPITLKGVVKTALVSAFSAVVTCGIGTMAESIGTFYIKATVQAVCHGVFNGGMSAAQGGSFWSGFASGAVSSVASSLMSKLGNMGSYESGNYNTDGTCQVRNFGMDNSVVMSVSTLAVGAITGGVGSSLSKGNFWTGAVTGLVVSGLNHAMHQGDNYEDVDQEDPPAKGSGKRYFMGDKFENAQFQRDIQAGIINPEIAYKSFMEYADMGLTFAAGMFPASSLRLGTTLHGTERIAGSLATRGGVLSLRQAWTTRILGSGFKQADGATVYLRQLSSGRYNAVVWGEKGIITTMKGWSQKSIDRIAKNYGWKF